jgi:hypothetical protein
MVDYSKWDKLASEISDDSDSEQLSNKPKVSVLDDNHSVMIDQNGFSIARSNQTYLNRSNLARAGDFIDERQWTKNGSHYRDYYWTQNRYEVVLRACVPNNTLARHIHFDINEDKQLLVEDKLNQNILVKGTIRYPFMRNDNTDEDPFDWELKALNNDTKIIEITIRKHSPIVGATIWWKNVFIDEPEIDLTKIEGIDKTKS